MKVDYSDMYEDRTLRMHLRGTDPELKVYQEPLQPLQIACDNTDDLITCGDPFLIPVFDPLASSCWCQTAPAPRRGHFSGLPESCCA